MSSGTSAVWARWARCKSWHESAVSELLAASLLDSSPQKEIWSGGHLHELPPRIAGFEGLYRSAWETGFRDMASSRNDIAIHEPDNTVHQLPRLNEATFSSLSKRLEEKIQSHAPAAINATKKEKSDRTRATSAKKPATNKDASFQRRNKRDSTGRVVKHKSDNGQQRSSSDRHGDQAELRREIELLGGTQADYDLVNSVESNSEIEDPSAKRSRKSDKVTKNGMSFEKDLSSILKEFSRAPQDEVHSTDSDPGSDSKRIAKGAGSGKSQFNNKGSSSIPVASAELSGKQASRASKMV